MADPKKLPTFTDRNLRTIAATPLVVAPSVQDAGARPSLPIFLDQDGRLSSPEPVALFDLSGQMLNVGGGRGVASVLVDSSGHLIVTYTDGATQDAGYIGGGGTPTPAPAPSFTTQPTITGTVKVGQPLSTLTYNDGVAANGTITTRAILLAGVATLGTYVLVDADLGKAVTYRNIATGVGLPATATSAAVTVQAATVTPTPSPSPHQLLAPTVTESASEDANSVAYQFQPAEDNQLPTNDSAGYGPGYMGFAVKVERATDIAVTSGSPGYTSEIRVINTPAFDEGVMDMAIVKGLVSGTTYYFAFSVIPPMGAEATYPQSPRVIKTKVVAAGLVTTFDTVNSGAGFTYSNSNRTILSTATSSDGRLAVTTDSVPLGAGQRAIQFRLDATATDPANYQVFGLTMSASGPIPNFFFEGSGNFRCDNQIDFSTPAVRMQWRGDGSPEALVDSGITIPDNNLLMAVDQANDGSGVTKITFYIKTKKTATYTVFNGTASPVRAYVSIKQPGQVTIVSSNVKPVGVQDWITA